MKKLTFSDTHFFYKEFQELVYKSGKLVIITDFKSAAEFPERGKRLFRLSTNRFGLSNDRFTGPVLKKTHQVTVGFDRFKRLSLLITGPDPSSS